VQQTANLIKGARYFLADTTSDEWFWEEETYTPPWYEEKTDLKRAWHFLGTNNFPLKNSCWGVQCIKFVWNVCFKMDVLKWASGIQE